MTTRNAGRFVDIQHVNMQCRHRGKWCHVVNGTERYRNGILVGDLNLQIVGFQQLIIDVCGSDGDFTRGVVNRECIIRVSTHDGKTVRLLRLERIQTRPGGSRGIRQVICGPRLQLEEPDAQVERTIFIETHRLR